MLEPNIFIIAGEPSGDIRAGELIKELKKCVPGASFWGIGGDRMEEQGVSLIEHIRDLSIIGVWEAIKNLPRIKRHYNNCIRMIEKNKPDAAILVDYPGFNLKIAEYLHSRNIPVIYYIIPQVWAWGSGRTKKLKRYTDKILVLFEFEKRFLEKYGIEAEFVGHPLLDKAPDPLQHKKKSSSLTVALLPGSRDSEIRNLLPPMLGAADIVNSKRADACFLLAENSNVDISLYDSLLSGYDHLDIRRIKDDTFDALQEADFAMVTSGTATLETAVMEVPFVIIYKVAPLTWFLADIFVKTPFAGLVNIIAGKEVAPELLQDKASPEIISEKALYMLDDASILGNTKDELRKVKLALGGKGAPKRAALAIERFLKDLDGDTR